VKVVADLLDIKQGSLALKEPRTGPEPVPCALVRWRWKVSSCYEELRLEAGSLETEIGFPENGFDFHQPVPVTGTLEQEPHRDSTVLSDHRTSTAVSQEQQNTAVSPMCSEPTSLE
jgi:hypothetical protein